MTSNTTKCLCFEMFQEGRESIKRAKQFEARENAPLQMEIVNQLESLLASQVADIVRFNDMTSNIFLATQERRLECEKLLAFQKVEHRKLQEIALCWSGYVIPPNVGRLSIGSLCLVRSPSLFCGTTKMSWNKQMMILSYRNLFQSDIELQKAAVAKCGGQWKTSLQKHLPQ